MLQSSPPASAPLIRVVDDDPSICGLISTLLTAHELRVQAYSSAEAFFGDFQASIPGCLVTDVRMPGMTGIELYELLRSHHCRIPTIIISGSLDVPTALRAMKNHPIDVLEKPFLPRVLLERVRQAIELDRVNRESAARSAEVTKKIAALTARERDVFRLVVAGHANKHIARSLQITEKTVEAHRGRLMKKMGARNVVDLVHVGVLANEAIADGR